MDLGKQGAAERVRAGEGRRADRGVVVGVVGKKKGVTRRRVIRPELV